MDPMQTETDPDIKHAQADGVMVGDRVVSTFCRRDDMRLLHNEKGDAIGYAHLPTGQLFTMKCNFSYESKPYPGHGPHRPFGGKGGMLQPSPNKAHIARSEAWERLLEEADEVADTNE